MAAERYKPQPSIEACIANALKSNGEADRNQLAELHDLAADKLDELRAAIDAETPRLHDLENPEPEKSLKSIELNQLRVERLTKAIGELAPRINALDHQAAVNEWLAEAVRLQIEAQALHHVLKKTYTEFVPVFAGIWQAVDENAVAIQLHRERRPSGVDFSLLDGDHPRLKLKLRLPSWDDPEHIVFPIDEAWQQQVALTNAMCEQAKALSLAGFPRADQDLDAMREAERAKFEADAKAKDQASRDALYRAQKRYIGG